MINFALGFLCSAAIFFYVNWRTGKAKAPVATVISKKKVSPPDNKRAQYCSTEEYRAEMNWAKANGKR